MHLVPRERGFARDEEDISASTSAPGEFEIRGGR